MAYEVTKASAGEAWTADKGYDDGKMTLRALPVDTPPSIPIIPERGGKRALGKARSGPMENEVREKLEALLERLQALRDSL